MRFQIFSLSCTSIKQESFLNTRAKCHCELNVESTILEKTKSDLFLKALLIEVNESLLLIIKTYSVGALPTTSFYEVPGLPRSQKSLDHVNPLDSFLLQRKCLYS